MMPAVRSTTLLAVFIVALLVAPLLLPEFYITLLDYIGLYAIVALGLVALKAACAKHGARLVVVPIPDKAAIDRAFQAMMSMTKLHLPTLQKAFDGG